MFLLEALLDIALHVHKRRQCVLAELLHHLEADLVRLGSLISLQIPQSLPRSQMHDVFDETLSPQWQTASPLTLKRRRNDRNADDVSADIESVKAVLQSQRSQIASWISSIN
jgi:hypothetical protein